VSIQDRPKRQDVSSITRRRPAYLGSVIEVVTGLRLPV